MAGPWEKYQTQQADGPWSKYQNRPARNDQMTARDVGAAALDYGKAAAAGLGRGLSGILDTAETIVNPINAARRGMADAGIVQDVGVTQQPSQTVRDVTGGAVEYRGDSFGEKVAGTAAEFLPYALSAGGAPVRAATSYALAPAVASEAAGAATEGKSLPENIPLIGGQDAEPYARLASVILAPFAANAAERGLRTVVTPYPADPARLEAAKRLEAEGVKVTAGQKTGATALQYREEMADRTVQLKQDQLQDFTAAVLRRIGVDGKRATPELLNQADDTIGAAFQAAARDLSIKPDFRLSLAARRVLNEYTRNTAKSNLAPVVKNVADKFDDALKAGRTIPGKQLMSWRSQLSKLTRSNDKQLADAAKGLIGAIDDAAMRSSSPEAVAAYNTARSQWQQLLVVDRAISSAGTDAASGIINPQQLRTAVKAIQGEKALSRGKTDFGELARAGSTAMEKLPQSGTQPRTLANQLSASAGGAGTAGGLAYALTGDPTVAGYAGILGAVAPQLRNQASASAAGQRYLGNQLLADRNALFESSIWGPIMAEALRQKEDRKKK